MAVITRAMAKPAQQTNTDRSFRKKAISLRKKLSKNAPEKAHLLSPAKTTKTRKQPTLYSKMNRQQLRGELRKRKLFASGDWLPLDEKILVKKLRADDWQKWLEKHQDFPQFRTLPVELQLKIW